MDNKNEILDYIKQRSVEINKKINEYLTDGTSPRYLGSLLGRSGYEYDIGAINKAVIEPAKYLLDLGGKRWRPILLLTVIDAMGKNSADFTEFSIIPEVIHNGTLIHDDIEDNSDYRRGSLAVHKKYGIDIGVNLGDFMYFFPMVALLDSKKIKDDTKIKILEVYQRELLKITLGQATDIAWHNALVDPFNITESQYMQMAYSKTGVLAGMAAKIGALLGGADQKTTDAFGKFGSSIGVAFQLQDDLLNITESALAEGKGGKGDDISEGKITLMVVYTLAKAKEKEKKRLKEILSMHTKDPKLIAEAIAIIDKYGAKEYASELEHRIVKDAWKDLDKLIPNSDSKKRLKEMAEFLVNRSL
jgi:geranylgeranyl diphosphate synthase, type I